MFTTAKREKAHIKLLVDGSHAAPRVPVALALAKGLGIDWQSVFVIQSSPISPTSWIGDPKYKIGNFKHARMTAPFDPSRLLLYLDQALGNGAACIVIDDLSEFWSGEMGTYYQYQKLGSKFEAWGTVDPPWYKMIAWLASAPVHVIAVCRSKYVTAETTDNRDQPISEIVPTAPEIRSNAVYKFSAHVRVNANATAKVIASNQPDILPAGGVLGRENLTSDGISNPALTWETLGANLALWAEMGAAPLIRYFGDMSILDQENFDYVDQFDAYKLRHGVVPYDINQLTRWYAGNKEKVDKLIEQMKSDPPTAETVALVNRIADLTNEIAAEENDQRPLTAGVGLEMPSMVIDYDYKAIMAAYVHIRDEMPPDNDALIAWYNDDPDHRNRLIDQMRLDGIDFDALLQAAEIAADLDDQAGDQQE